MARKPADRSVYPPRYFLGFVELDLEKGGGAVRINFGNAPMIPEAFNQALVFPGSRDSAFYGAVGIGFPSGRLRTVQYAISVYDGASDSYRVEKFNHAFSSPSARMAKAGLALVMTATKLFRVYRVDEVMSGFKNCAVPVIQFVA